MKVGNIWKAEEWSQSATASTVDAESYQFTSTPSNNYERRERRDREALMNDLKDDPTIAYLWFTDYSKDNVDAVVQTVSGTLGSVEIKGIEGNYEKDTCNDGTPRYSISTLYEDLKKVAQERLYREKGMFPIYVRYYFKDRKRISFKLNKIDWAKDATYEDSFYCTKNSMEDREKKTKKKVWLLNNNKGTLKQF